MAEHIIELQDVTKYFGDNLVIDHMSFYVNKGEFITFLGPSGCGKTTTLRMIAGFDLPTSGKILLNGEDISRLPPTSAPSTRYSSATPSSPTSISLKTSRSGSNASAS